MATRKPPGLKTADLSVEAQRAPVARLESLVRELEQFDVNSVSTLDDQKVRELRSRIRSTLSQIYGEDSFEFRRLRGAADLYKTDLVFNLAGRPIKPSVEDIRRGIGRARASAIADLRGELESLRDGLALITEISDSEAAAPSRPSRAQLGHIYRSRPRRPSKGRSCAAD